MRLFLLLHLFIPLSVQLQSSLPTRSDSMDRSTTRSTCASHETCRRSDADPTAMHNRVFRVPDWASGPSRPSDAFLAYDVWNRIDAVLYVNLKHRTDRKKSILSVFERWGVPKDKIRRIDAIRTPEAGEVGCALSMARSLDTAWKEGWERVLIFQDDFLSAHSASITTRLLSAFLRRGPDDWDGALLAWGTGGAEYTSWDFLLRTTGAKTMSGFFAHRRIFTTLRDRCLLSADRLKAHRGVSGNYARHAADVMWNKLMETGRWYLFLPKLGYVRDD